MPLLKPRKALKSPTSQCLQLTSLTRARRPLRPQRALQLRLLKHKEQPTLPNHRARQRQPSHKAQLRLLKQKRRPKPAAQLKQQTCQCQPRNQNLLNLS